jgi:hypothetical protein
MSAALEEQIATSLAKARDGSVSADDIADAIKSPLPTGLNAQEIYSLLCFVRHERRQKWVGFLVESRLRGHGSELANHGAFAHPEELPQSGDVPGEAGWRYFFHGRGCCFTHSDGISIDVDFADDGTALDIDPYFFTHYLQSLPEPEWCERQLKQSEGFENAWQFDLERLESLGLITREWRFRLTEKGRNLGELMEPIVDSIDEADPRTRCLLLAKLGDVENAATYGEPASLAAFLDVRKRQSAQRIGSLKNALHGVDESQARFALSALGLLGPETALDDLRAALSYRPPNGLNHAAFAVLKHWGGRAVTECLMMALRQMTRRSFMDAIRRLISTRNSMESERPRLGLVVGMAEELMRRTQPTEISAEARDLLIASLQPDCFAMEDEAAFLLFLLKAELGLPKLARSLSSKVPIVRRGAACFLMLIGDAKCIDILIQAASQLPDCGGHEAACALSLMDDERAQRASQQWLRRNDGYEEAEGSEVVVMGRTIQTWSMAEMMRSQMRDDVSYASERIKQKFSALLSLWQPIA